MNRKKLLEKIYYKLVDLDFDQLSFHNHILIDEIIADVKKLKNFHNEIHESPPELPPLPIEGDNVLAFVPPPRKLHSLKLMVLDDDKDILNLLEYSFKNEYEIELVCHNSPRKALQEINSEKPDLILLDISLKEMTSYEFLNELRLIDKKREIEVIVGSHNPNQHEKNSYLEMGAFDYITKPYDLTEVKFKLKLRLEKKKQCS